MIEADFSERTVTLGMECGDYKVSAGKHWLSTTPPQRQPLTEDVIRDLWREATIKPCYTSELIRTFTRAIERAHGIGGGE
jgi:hypothetical protein